METYSQNRSIDRQPVAAGRFYSANPETLRNDIALLFKNCKIAPDNKSIRAIISPHAGYVYSGKIAAAAFSTISPKKVYKNIFIIGSSHMMLFDGASAYNSGDFITPIGKIRVNDEIADKLKSENKEFDFPSTCHIQEHSIEVQLPFIQYYFEDTPMIVPIIIGTNNENSIKQIAEILRPWFTPDNLFIISSDFSHYPSYEDAIKVDKLTAESIISGNSKIFLSTLKQNSSKQIPGLATSMCGWSSGLLLLHLLEGNNQVEIKHVDYCNSGDYRFGSKDEVVGYHAIIIAEKNRRKESDLKIKSDLSFTDEENSQLFAIARMSIESILYDKKYKSVDAETISPKLREQMGAFVTLKIKGALRGCIGRFTSSDPLYEAVKESARSSAFEDPRFSTLTREEYTNAEIEITVLGPLVKIKSINEIVLGKHGIYIKKDFVSGTMLPQVATDNGWTVEEFLGYTSREKAGLGWDGWRDADIYIYEGIVLKDKHR